MPGRRCARPLRTDALGDACEHSAGTALSTVSAIRASPPCGRAADLRPGDVDPRLAERRADGADDAGPVGVPEEQQVLGRHDVDVEAVDLGDLLDLARAGQRAATPTAAPFGSTPRTVMRLR